MRVTSMRESNDGMQGRGAGCTLGSANGPGLATSVVTEAGEAKVAVAVAGFAYG